MVDFSSFCSDVANAKGLSSLACNRESSFMIETIFQSDFIGSKEKKRLAEKLSGTFVSLSCDKFGSHVLESIWKCVDWPTKAMIASELQANLSRVRDNFYGKFVISRCNIAQFDCSAIFKGDTEGSNASLVKNKGEKVKRALEDILFSGEKKGDDNDNDRKRRRRNP